jgi:SAM-dependent MidA family methyltransferase
MLSERLQSWMAQHPQGRVRFRDWMEWVLYDPEQGYYARSAARIGPQGDFLTSAHLDPVFGRCLARQFAEMWFLLGQPEPFVLVEMGAGQGLMARDILNSLQSEWPDCFQQVQYRLVERSPAQRRVQAKLLAPWQDRLDWWEWSELEQQAVVGCCFSNELVDALPVHLLEWRNGSLQEVYLRLAEGQVVEELASLSEGAIAHYFDDLGIHFSSPTYPEGYRTEVNLAAYDWLRTVAQGLKRGWLLTLDYGYDAARYYSPQRYQGTLQAYTRQRFHNDIYLDPGNQDLTAHTNFTALEQWGETLGLHRQAFTRQGLFLMALGLGEVWSSLASEATDLVAVQAMIQRRQALQELINPLGLGNFGVLLQSRGLSETEQCQPLRGFQEPTGDLLGA